MLDGGAMHAVKSSWILALLLALFSLPAGCGGGGDDDDDDDSAADGDADSDGDSDGDSDADSDGDTDADADADDACEATSPRSVELEVQIQPDEGDARFVDFLESAESSIHLMIYQLGWTSEYVDILIEKAEAGVEVAVIMHDPEGTLSADNQDAQDQMVADLEAAGVQFRYQPAEFSDEYDFYHVKTLVVDRAHAWISTGNLVPYFMERERNIDVWDDDPQDVADALEIFDADFEERSPDLSCTRLVVAPDNARERILALIDSAQETLDIHSMQFKDDDVREAVAARAAAGVEVRVLLASPGWISDNYDAATFLDDAGVTAHYQDYPDTHIKMVLVDGAWAYAGSVNLSWNSLTNNREIGVIFSDAAALQAIADTFDGDWGDSTAF